MAGWYVRRGEKVVGPVVIAEAKELAAAGKILPTDYWQKMSPALGRNRDRSRGSPNPFKYAPSTMIKPAVGILLLVAGCGSPQSQPVASNSQPVGKAPFEYEIIKRDETPFMGQPKVALTVETTNDVAKKATEADLEQFWKFIQPTLGNGRIRIDLFTPVPGADSWGFISHWDVDGKWKVEILKKQSGVDAEPDCFMTEIDKSKKNQDKMILTLPVVNRIVEKLTRRGWKLKSREVNDIEMNTSIGPQSFRVTLWPEEIYLTSFGRDNVDITDWTDTAMVLVDELGIGDDLKTNLQSVIGGPEYMRAAAGKPAKSEWTIGDYYVLYIHYPGMDDLKINDAKTAEKAKAKRRAKTPTK